MSKRRRIQPLRILGALTVLQLLIVPTALAQEEQAAPQDPVGYFLGLSVGQQMRQNGFRPADLEVSSLIAGFTDGLGDKDSALSDDQLQETQLKIQKLVQARQLEMQSAQKAKGTKFLADNAKKDGVKILDGGVQYKVLSAGKGESPKATDTVKVHYTGKLIDGSVFDSSVKRGEPATFRVNQVIKGWQMSLQKMRVGDKWMLYIPSDLAYGPGGSPPAIGPNEVLVFEVELLAIQ